MKTRKVIFELDGIRALSIVAVLLVHVSYGRIVGGFLGVDVFFVLSGYLITRLMLLEIREHGTINLRKFYARRALRILPPLVFASVLGVSFGNEQTRTTLSELYRVAAVLLFFSNFETPQVMGNLAHTWSLAIEEQFYLVWPILLLVSLRVGRMVPLLTTASVVVICLGVRYSMVENGGDLNSIYSYTFARVDSILVGCFAALISVEPSSTAKPSEKQVQMWSILSWFTLLILATAVFSVTREYVQTQPTAFTLIAASAAVFIVGCQRMKDANLIRKILARGTIQWLGRRSYGLYLYHYPIFGAFELLRVPGDSLNFILVAFLKVSTSLIVTELAWRYMEKPILSYKEKFSVSSGGEPIPVKNVKY